MARLLRLEQAGAWYHITARGNERRAIYRDERDRRHFLELLPGWLERFRTRLHAYVLMENHYHLLLETCEANLSRAMQWLNTSYSVWFNRRHQRAGHLFQGRFKAVMVEPESWALALSRYIHLNPVRLKRLGLAKGAQRAQRQGVSDAPDPRLVKQRLDELRRYRWSSYRAYAGWEKPPAWLESQTVLGLGGGRPAIRRQRYREYVENAVREGIAGQPWEGLIARLVLGSREFVEKLIAPPTNSPKGQELRKSLAQRPSFAAVVKAVERLKGESWKVFRDRHGDSGRELALQLGRELCGLTLTQLGRESGAASSMAVSTALKRFRGRLDKDKTLASALRQAKSALVHETNSL